MEKKVLCDHICLKSNDALKFNVYSPNNFSKFVIEERFPLLQPLKDRDFEIKKKILKNMN